jgi:hypothetical protein
VLAPSRVRTAAKAIVVRDDHLLAIKCRGREGVFYILPGGGQVGVEWLPLGRIDEFPLMPRALRARLRDRSGSGGAVYLGDVN